MGMPPSCGRKSTLFDRALSARARQCLGHLVQMLINPLARLNEKDIRKLVTSSQDSKCQSAGTRYAQQLGCKTLGREAGSRDLQLLTAR